MVSNTVKEGETNKDYYEKGSDQKAQVTAVQLKKLEQVCFVFHSHMYIFFSLINLLVLYLFPNTHFPSDDDIFFLPLTPLLICIYLIVIIETKTYSNIRSTCDLSCWLTW